MCWCVYIRLLVSQRLTFQAARPPEARVRHHLLVLFASLVLVGALDFADAARVQPVVCAHGDGHEAEGGKGPHRGQQHLNPAVKHTHVATFHERGAPFPFDVQEVNTCEFASPRQLGKRGVGGDSGGVRRATVAGG